jgi:hypothetical protein
MKLLIAAALLLCAAGSVAAQPPVAVVGSVVDQTGAPLPGVRVTIRGVAVRSADTAVAHVPARQWTRPAAASR